MGDWRGKSDLKARVLKMNVGITKLCVGVEFGQAIERGPDNCGWVRFLASMCR